MRALIVDDDPQLQELFGAVLTRGDFEISCCHDGQAALALPGRPALVLVTS